MKAAIGFLAVMLAFIGASGALAQTAYPDKPVRILVGFTPGVAPDITSRLLADKFTEAWGKAVVVENVTGAGGNIATDRVAKAAPDGYTLLMGGNASIIFNPSLYQNLPYDPVKDFAPITQVFIAANVLAVNNDSPVKGIAHLITLARAQPGKLTYGHAGVGTSQHLAGELFKAMAKIELEPVAYRGSTAIMPDLVSGRLTFCFCNVVNVMPLAREGKLRVFAVTSLKRSAVVPGLPTMVESGFAGFEAVPWFGLMAPAGTPLPVIDKVHRETVRLLALPDLRKKLEDLGLDVVGNSPAEFAALIKAELPQWAKVIKDAGIKASE
jgi:tripartite-type tricarboxylate transporter receptor subunit TctC